MKDYFSFNSRERLAILLLCCLMAFFWLLPDFFPDKQAMPTVQTTIPPRSEGHEQFYPAAENATASESSSPAAPGKAAANSRKLFAFNPNTIDEAGWKKLGVRDKTIQTILHYRQKGGKFRQPSDLKKIWGMQEQEAVLLIPYVLLPGESRSTPNSNTGKFVPAREPLVKPVDKTININLATVTEWKSLPGIGDVLAARIVRFRDKLGGFQSIGQVRKTYGLSDSVFQQIQPLLVLSSEVNGKININTASVQDLQKCPVISEAIAQAIVQYRKQYGRYGSVDDLKRIVFINDSKLQAMSPYLVAN